LIASSSSGHSFIHLEQEFRLKFMIEFCFCSIHSDTTAYVAEIINTIGTASAAAQGLSQPVTTSDRLRNTEEQVIYLMTEDDGKK